MAGEAQPRLLRRQDPPGIRFEHAGPERDPAIRALLRVHPMGGTIRLALTREPHAAHAASIEGDRHITLAALDASTDELVGVGSRSVRDVWVDGRVERLGYLGGLRMDPAHHRSLGALPAAYRELGRTRLPGELPFDLTSILRDNRRARRLLESGCHGLPPYRRLGRYITFLIPPARGRQRLGGVTRGRRDLAAGIARCLQRNLRRYQFAPVWTEEDLLSDERTRDLPVEDFLTLKDGERVTGCLALWDQRRFKQVVVRGYAPGLGRWRSWINWGLRAAGRLTLPDPGSLVNLAYVSHVAVDGDDPDALTALIRSARASAAGTDLDFLVVGFAARNPLADVVRRRFPARSLESVLYLVGGPPRCAFLDGARIPHVECATL